MVNRFSDIPRVQPSVAPAERLQIALALFPLGLELMAERLRGDNPSWSDQKLQHEVSKWLADRGHDGWGDGFRVHLA